MNETMTCNSCDKSKAQLFVRRSAFLKGINLYMCKSCIDQGFEPRWTIILAGRTHGYEIVKDIILKHKYVGPDIKFEEIIK